MYHCKNESEGIPILGVKLFGISALAIAALALVPFAPTARAFDFYIHDAYIIFVSARRALLEFALLCVVCAGFYYAGHGLSRNRMHRGLALAHFLLWMLSTIIIVVEAHFLASVTESGHDPNEYRLLVAGFVIPPLAFLTGAALFFVNLVRAIVRRYKTS